MINSRPWYRELNRYHWYVLVIAALGWLFDTMDQQLFVLVRTPALRELLDPNLTDPDIRHYGGIATAIFMVGWATGGLVFGLFGDRWGRARTMMLTILIYSIFTGLSAFSVSWYDFAFYRFVTGMGVGGEFAAGVSLVAEVMPAAARPYALGLLQALSAVGNMTAALLSLAIPPQMEMQGVQGWRILFLLGVAPALLVVAVRRRLKEPESWLAAKRAIEQGAQRDEMHRQMGDLRELFGEREWRRRTILGVLLAMSGVMALWGVGFWTPELVRENLGLPKDQQDWYASIAMLLQNFGGFFGIYAYGSLTSAVGRKWAFAVSFVVGPAAVVMVFGFMTDARQIWWMVPLLGFGTLMVFGGYAIYFPELFPTRLRSTGTGFCYNVARYLAATAPFTLGHLSRSYVSAEPARAAEKLADFTWLGQLGSTDDAFRYAALSVATIYLLGLLVVPFLPETKDKPLPE